MKTAVVFIPVGIGFEFALYHEIDINRVSRELVSVTRRHFLLLQVDRAVTMFGFAS